MLEVTGLKKKFGTMTAVDDLNFTIPPGKILGLIGQNGAGKTTTFRLLLNFLKATEGSVRWQNEPLSEKHYNEIGYLPEERGLYPQLTIEQQLIYFGLLRGKTKKEIVSQIDEWMEKFQVKGQRKDKIKTLSKGNQQKIQVISTLIHKPKLVILDEPFSGLDPVNADLLTQGIRELREQGASVIFSSHNMENVEQICDELIMLKDGKTVLNGAVQTIREGYGRTKLQVETPLSESELAAIPGVLQVVTGKGQSKFLQLADEAAGKTVFEYVTRDGYIPIFNQQPPTLEEIFKRKVGDLDA